MRLDEVTAFQERKLEETDWKNPKQVAAWLRSKNFKQKGSGAFGAAFVHPNYNRIVKISRRQDVCWLRFAYWTLRMTSNPSVPYIDWVRVYGEGDKFFIAVIEKLAPFNRAAINNTKDVAGLAYLYVYEDWFQGNMAIENRLIKEGVIYNEDAAFNPQVKKFLKNAKTGKRFIRTLRSAQKFATKPCDYDMHDGNLMYRPSDQSLVIIDPLADLSELGFFF